MKEYNVYDGVRILLRKARGRCYSYRRLCVDNILLLNVPEGEKLTDIARNATDFIKSGKRENLLNDLKDGGFIMFFGIKCPLHLQKGEKINIKFEDNEFFITVKNNGFDDEAQRELKKFYRRQLVSYIKKTLPQVESRVGLFCEKIGFTSMVSAWGKCNWNTKKITFSINLATQPHYCINMVIVHELGHLLYHNHGKEFHAYMDKFCPNHAQIRRQMKM